MAAAVNIGLIGVLPNIIKLRYLNIFFTINYKNYLNH